jgi:hypothetical protein
MASPEPAVRAHASAAERLLRHPDTAFEPSLKEAQRMRALGRQGQPREQ